MNVNNIQRIALEIMKRNIIVVIILLAAIAAQAQINSAWTTEEIKHANTAATCPYMNQVEKDVVLYNNLARLFPKKFVRVELADEPETANVRSLKSELKSMQPIAALTIHEQETELAQCWALKSGEKGIVGHKRDGCEPYYLGGIGAENCSYGKSTGREIILQLLIDEGVSSLGHRKNCLNDKLIAIGVGFATHKVYDYCCVMDFTGFEGVNYAK